MSDPTLVTWNKLAGLYEEKFMDLTIYDQSYEQFTGLISGPKAAILDVGCGPGNVARYLQRKNPDWRFHGVDAAPNMVELFRKNIPGSTITVMDIRNIGTLKRSFDGIVAGFSIPYLNDRDTLTLIRDFRMLLHPEGAVYISFVEGDPAASGLITGSTGDQTYFYYHREVRVRDMMQAAGLQVYPALKVVYSRSAGQQEMHTILIGKLSEV